MADKNRNRTNWSDKARRITGGVTLAIVILIIILCVVLGKKDKAVEPQITVPSASVETEVVVKEPEKTPEPITVEPTVPLIDEPIKDIVEEAEPVAEPEPQYTSGEMVFDACGITVENTWSEGTFISTSSEKDRFSPNDVMDFVRYEADKYQNYMDEVTVLKITASTGTIKIEYPPYMDPAIFMPYYKADIEEYAASIAPKDEVVIEEPVEVVEEVVVEEPTVIVEMPVIEEAPVVEETLPFTADFSVFGYTVKNSWVPGTLTSVSETKGLLSEADVRGFVLYEIAKYGDLLVNNTSVEFIPDGFVLTYPETEDASLYIPTYKSDIEEYVNTLFAPVEEEAPAASEEPVVEETLPFIADFSVFGYTVKNSWVPGTLTSVSETKGLLSEADVRGFVLYEIAKYGDLLVNNTSVEFIPDGFVLTYPETEDASLYIPTYKSDIEEYVNTLFAPVEEAPVVEEAPAAPEEPAVEVPSAPAEPEAKDVPAQVEVQEVVVSPKAEKLSSYKFKFSVAGGAEFGINNAVSYTTIFPRLSFISDFQNVFSISRVGFGVRLDLSGVFKPIDGTFIGHDFEFLRHGDNWAVDAMLDAKLMVYGNWDNFQVYAGAGIGYSIGSSTFYPYTHTKDFQIFGFDTATALSAVAGFEYKLGKTFTLSLEGYYRFFFNSESKAQTFAAMVAMGWKF